MGVGGGGGGPLSRGGRVWCRRVVCYGRVLPGRGEPPTSAQALDRRPKNPEFNGNKRVDS